MGPILHVINLMGNSIVYLTSRWGYLIICGYVLGIGVGDLAVA